MRQISSSLVPNLPTMKLNKGSSQGESLWTIFLLLLFNIPVTPLFKRKGKHVCLRVQSRLEWPLGLNAHLHPYIYIHKHQLRLTFTAVILSSMIYEMFHIKKHVYQGSSYSLKSALYLLILIYLIFFFSKLNIIMVGWTRRLSCTF